VPLWLFSRSWERRLGRSPASRSVGWAVLATMAWAIGLPAASFATFCGLVSQRSFSRAERLRRQEVERTLLAEKSELRRIVASKDPKYERDTEDGKGGPGSCGCRGDCR
jgi:hypothetical protein